MEHTANLICHSCGSPRFQFSSRTGIYVCTCCDCGRQASFSLPSPVELKLHEIETPAFEIEPEGEG